MEMDLTVCSETSAHKIHTPENHPKERTNRYTCREVRIVSHFENASLTFTIRYFNTFHIHKQTPNAL